MTFIIRTRGDIGRPILCDFRCPEHGKFTALVASDDSDAAPCSTCGTHSPWTPSVIPMRMCRVEATRGNHERAEHKGWLDTSNLEEGQDFGDWQADREAVHEELRKDLVMEMVRSDR